MLLQCQFPRRQFQNGNQEYRTLTYLSYRILAGYFKVSLDTLFDYDMREINEKVEKIITDAHGENREIFFDDPKQISKHDP